MRQFIAGFVIALLAIVPTVAMFLRTKNRGDKRNSLKELEELGKLTGGLAHEIKNPLSTIKVNLKLIAEELESPDSAEFGRGGQVKNERVFAKAIRKIDVIQKEAERLEQILDGFLRYVDRGKFQLANVDINELVGDMVDFYSPQAHTYSITIRLGLHEEPLVCKIDADMLKQAVLNLFINAQQAMTSGGELIIKTARQEKMAVIEISDTGCGIDPEKLDKVFDAYFSSRPNGSGLGLPTAKKIIVEHKGKLTVNSTVGKGTLFTIKLPLLELAECT